MAKTKKKRKRFDCVVVDDGIVHLLTERRPKGVLYVHLRCKPNELTRTYRRQRMKLRQATCFGCLANT